MRLTAPLTASLLRTTQPYIDALRDLEIETVEDLLLYLPRAHEDLSQMQTIATAPLDAKVSLRGTVDMLKLVRTKKGKKLVTGVFIDGDGDTCEVIWFNQPHILRMLKEGDEVVLTGKLVENGYKIQLQSPQFERSGAKPLVHAGRLVPIYPQHEPVNTKWLREKMLLVRSAIDEFRETLPPDVVEQENLLPRAAAIRALHFPEKPEEVRRALERMEFEKMYEMQLQAMERKKSWQGVTQDRLKTPMNVELIRAFFASLKFTPTDSQRIAIYEILRDMEKDIPMSRLLEGDVGSGKTLVAVAIVANTIHAGGQSALMVPTEVLARQHAESIARLLLNFHAFMQKQPFAGSADFPLPTVSLLTGSTVRSEADDIKKRLAAGTVDVIVGTHALIEDTVRFKDLRLVIIDEQHRFGVLQRERLREKGSPHVLAMTATPIPRTLALTAFGDHDLSVLIEKPGRRQKIETKVVAPHDRRTVELFIDHQIGEGRQVFVICPLISESEELDEVRNVEQEVERLRRAFPHRAIAMLHGRMKPAEKQRIMQEFRDEHSHILVSTSVIEVGIDIPNATIIVIEGAERFGLAQLHQLRGRVGRGEYRSHCFLFSSSASMAHSPRLKAMEQYDSGFQLAEIDLKLRGPGEIYGVRQSGLPDLRVGTLMNPELIARARRAAEKEVFGEEKAEIGNQRPV